LALPPIAQALGGLREDETVALVQQALAADEPALAILGELQAGMSIVGERFEGGEYFLSELIYAAEIFKKSSAPLQEELQSTSESTVGTVVLGTVKSDIHQFGKDIVAGVLSSNGFTVVDLGVDVSHQAWVEAIEDTGASVVGMSCLLTTAFDHMKEAIATIERAGLRDTVTILAGGGPVNQIAADYVGADHYCESAQSGVVIAKNVLGVS